jgi:hypothetical protein
MKKITIVISGVLLATTLSFVSATTVQAEECSTADPCGTWAVLDDAGVVTNIIVCQPSVCGSGTFGENRVVLQVPSNPTTNKPYGGYYNTEPEKAVTYNDQTNTFSMGSVNSPAPLVRSENVDSITLSTTIHSTVLTFGPSTFSDGKMEFIPVVDTSTAASISATYLNGNEITKENLAFATPQTVEEIRVSLTEELVMLRTNLNKLIALLKGWVKN